MSQRYIGGLIYNPPGGFSGYFDGSGDYLDAGSNAALAPGSGVFTWECWLFPNSFTQDGSGGTTLWISNTTNGLQIGRQSTGAGSGWGIAASGTAWRLTSTTLPTNGQWNHLAISRDGSNNTAIFLNGTRIASGSVTDTFATASTYVGGGPGSGQYSVNGYLSSVRFVKGTAVYDPTQTTITVPSGPLQAITNTSLLTCAYGTFRDGSTNNFTITVNGNTAVSTQNPFPLTTLPNPALGNQGNGIYSMSQYQALLQQNLWPAVDPYWEYVTLMLHGNGTNGAQNNTFLDSSTNNFSVTRNGNTTQGTFSPYGSNWSNFFDGTDDYLTVADNAAFEFGSGNFTIEGWVYLTAGNSTNRTLIAKSSRDNASGEGSFVVQISNANKLQMLFDNATGGGWVIDVSGTTNVLLNTWYHFAVVRNGNVFTAYLNGVSEVTATNSLTLVDNGQVLTIGALGYTSGTFVSFTPGYISNIRLVKGTAVYTSAFTPPTSPLTAITNTSLLTCADNRFIDDSSNNFTITRNGDVSVQRFSPFNPTAPYAAGTIGGSGYFDGSGDYLTTSSNTPMDFGTGAFTIEGWVYTGDKSVSGGASRTIIGNSGNSYTMQLYIDTSVGKVVFGNTGSTNLQGTSGIANSAWHHIAIVRSGTGTNQTALFVDGVREAVGTNSQNYTSGTIYIGAFGTTDGFWNGYMSGLRIVKGTAVYDPTQTTLTVPTSPATAITNTALLLSYTNGGIIDNAMMNDLETVGNAQISTSVSKFGGGSLAFDGTGDGLVPNATIGATAFGTGDFTIEFWAYITNTGATQATIIDSRAFGSTSTTNQIYIIYTSANNISFFTNGAYRINSSAITQNTWNHVALVRASGSTKMYLNGVQTGSTYTDTNNYAGNPNRPAIGVDATDLSSFGFPGNIDDLRITKGYARYTANFTPQRSQWQDQ